MVLKRYVEISSFILQTEKRLVNEILAEFLNHLIVESFREVLDYLKKKKIFFVITRF